MKYRAYAIYVAAILISTVLAFVLPPDQAEMAGMMAILFAVVTVFSAFVEWPPGGAFVEHKPYLMRSVGGVLEALAVGVFAWGFEVGMRAPASDDSKPYITAAILIGLTGFLVISAPRISRQSREARARREALTAAKRQGYSESDFDGVTEGMLALQAPLKSWNILVRIAWPWLLGCLGSVGVALALSPGAPKGDLGPLTWLLVAILIAAVGLPTIAVAWHRWLIEQKKPAWVVLPDGSVFPYLWRLWIFASVTGRGTSWAGDAVTSALQGVYPRLASTAGGVTGDLLFAAACVLASNFALRLPAVAVRDKGFEPVVMIGEARRLWPGLPIGLLFSIAPFMAAQIGLEGANLWTPRVEGQAANWLFVLEAGGDMMLAFLAFAAATALLSRAYLTAKARLAAPI